MNKKLLLVIIPIVTLLICCIGLLCFVNTSDSADTVYYQQIKIAEKYLANNDFENAIVHYNKAIELDKTNETAYIALAEIYNDNLGDLNKALEVLTIGFENTTSGKIKKMIARYTDLLNDTDTEPASDEKGENSDEIINVARLTVFGNYDYSQYFNNYAVRSDNYTNGRYSVRYDNLDAEFTYYNSQNNNGIIDNSTLKPYDYSFPCEIVVDDLSNIISGVEIGVSINEIKKSPGVTKAVMKYNNTLKKNIVTFTCENCTIYIECDSNGIVKGIKSYNLIKPLQASAQSSKIKVAGKVISVTTAMNVNNVRLRFRSGKDARTGDIAEEYNSPDGNYTAELIQGDYTVEVFASGYTTEYFDLHVNGASQIEHNFSISPILTSGEVRIVLEWGATPSDLDSHLIGTTANGKNIDVSYHNMSEKENGNVIAKLDVDDRNGFGPETITLSQTAGTFKYKVHRFSGSGTIATSNAVVKVYLPSQSQPVIINVPSNATSDWWDVFTIKNGQISDINGITE